MIRLFFHSVKSRRFVYIAGGAVVAVVIAALVVQQSLSISAENQIHDLVHNLGKNMLVVPAETDLFNFYTQRYDGATMPEDYPVKIRSSAVGLHIRRIQPQLFGKLKVDGIQLILVGQQGLFCSSGAPESSTPYAVLGNGAARHLELAPGDTLTADGILLVLARAARSLPDGYDLAVLTELSVAQRILGRPGTINYDETIS